MALKELNIPEVLMCPSICLMLKRIYSKASSTLRVLARFDIMDCNLEKTVDGIEIPVTATFNLNRQASNENNQA